MKIQGFAYEARDNHSIDGKLSLRRELLKQFVRPLHVVDCCQGSGKIWSSLRREFSVASYLGIDIKKKPGRLKMDSVVFLSQRGWLQNVIDIDTYGTPWGHWRQVLQNAVSEELLVFLTYGRLALSIESSVKDLMGISVFSRRVPRVLACSASRWQDRGVVLNLQLAKQHGFEILRCIEVPNPGGSARYIGVHLRRLQP